MDGRNRASHTGHLAGITHCSILSILSFPHSHPWAIRTPPKHQLCWQVKPELAICCLGWLVRASGWFPPQLSMQIFLVLHHGISMIQCPAGSGTGWAHRCSPHAESLQSSGVEELMDLMGWIYSSGYSQRDLGEPPQTSTSTQNWHFLANQ